MGQKRVGPETPEARAAWESAGQARRAVTAAWGAVAVNVLIAAITLLAPGLTELFAQNREATAYQAALDDEIDRSNEWLLAGMSVHSDWLFTRVEGLTPRSPYLDFAWLRRIQVAEQRLQSLAVSAPAHGSLALLRKRESAQLEQLRGYVDAVAKRPVLEDEETELHGLDITSRALGEAINQVEVERHHPAPFCSTDWPLVDRETSGKRVLELLRTGGPDAVLRDAAKRC